MKYIYRLLILFILGFTTTVVWSVEEPRPYLLMVPNGEGNYLNILKVLPTGEIATTGQAMFGALFIDASFPENTKYIWQFIYEVPFVGTRQYVVNTDGVLTTTGRAKEGLTYVLKASRQEELYLVSTREETFGVYSVQIYRGNPDGSEATTSPWMKMRLLKASMSFNDGLFFSYQASTVDYDIIPYKFMICRVKSDSLSIETVGLYQNENSQQIKPDVLFTPDGKWFAAVRDALYVDIYPILSDGQLDTTKRYSYAQNADYTLTCTPDSKHIYSGSFQGLSSTPGRIGRFDYSEDSGCFIRNGEYVFMDGSEVLNADITPDGRLMIISLQLNHSHNHKIITMHVSPTGELTPTGYEFMYSQIMGDFIPIEDRTYFLSYPLPTFVPVHQWEYLN